jgi:hypothetical protein
MREKVMTAKNKPERVGRRNPLEPLRIMRDNGDARSSRRKSGGIMGLSTDGECGKIRQTNHPSRDIGLCDQLNGTIPRRR